MLPVGDGRRRCDIVSLVTSRLVGTGAEFLAPEFFAFCIVCEEIGVFAAVGGWLMLGEMLTLRGLFGCGLMLAGMLLSELSGYLFKK